MRPTCSFRSESLSNCKFRWRSVFCLLGSLGLSCCGVEVPSYKVSVFYVSAGFKLRVVDFLYSLPDFFLPFLPGLCDYGLRPDRDDGSSLLIPSFDIDSPAPDLNLTESFWAFYFFCWIFGDLSRCFSGETSSILSVSSSLNESPPPNNCRPYVISLWNSGPSTFSLSIISSSRMTAVAFRCNPSGVSWSIIASRSAVSVLPYLFTIESSWLFGSETRCLIVYFLDAFIGAGSLTISLSSSSSANFRSGLSTMIETVLD